MNNQLPQPVQSDARADGEGFKFTTYRLLVVMLTAGFGLPKAWLSYHGYSTAPTTMEWLYGVWAFLT